MEFLLVLAVLACPVGMGLMMWFMGRGMQSSRSAERASASGEDLRREHARLTAQIERLERDEARAGARPAGNTR